MDKKISKSRQEQIRRFLDYLNEDWVELTAKQIRFKFFNNSRSFTDLAISELESSGIIEVDRQIGSVYLGGKWTKNPNRYRIINHKETSFKEKDGNRTINFKYKGIYDVTETFKPSDKDIVKKVKEGLKNLLNEESFVEICISYGFSKEKSWYFYQKIRQTVLKSS